MSQLTEKPMTPKDSGEEITGYSEAMPILDHHVKLECKGRTRLPISLRRINRILMLLFILMVLSLAVLPWQQFIPGTGKVTAFNPMERLITVEAPLPGRVDVVNVVEGQKVRKGEILFRITDNDPQLMENLQSQLLQSLEQRTAVTNRLQKLKSRVIQVEQSLPRAMDMARAQVEAARASLTAAELNFKRIESLFLDERGLVSQRDYELATMQRDNRKADLLRQEQSLLKTELDLNASIESARASVDSAQADLNKLNKEITDLEIKINQTGTLNVPAPRDGVIYRVSATEGSFLKAGTPMCVVVPETADLVVELWVDGNDMPLISERVVDENGEVVKAGSPVRLQFEGWPAIQFVGWPSAAIGTFGGEVIFVDAIDNGNGMFRLLVAPDPDEVVDSSGNEQIIPWPSSPVLRQGVAAQGWILLERVPLWFEVWRQLNGFPPALKEGKNFSISTKSK